MRSAHILSRRVDLEQGAPELETEGLDPDVLTLHPRSVPASASDLGEPVWSVIGFDGIEAGGLTYTQAAALMAELDRHGIAGLCIVTDGAASRIKH